MKRNEFIKTLTLSTAGFAGIGTVAGLSEACAQTNKAKNMHGLSLGVSVYSYNRDFNAGITNLEGCMADIADMGAEGIEILGEAHIPNYPNPPKEWIDKWFTLLEKYNLKPTAYDLFTDTLLHKGRRLTAEECLEEIMPDFKLANQLGYKTFRGGEIFYPPDDPADNYLFPYVYAREAMRFFEIALPTCEKYDVRFAVEMHSPSQIRSKWIEGILEVIERTKTQYVGFNPDLGIFTSRPAHGTVEGLIQRGAKKEIIDYIVSAYQQRLSPEKTLEEVKKMGGGQIEQQYASVGGIFHSSNNDPKNLKIIAPYVYHTHAKSVDQMENLTDYCIDYPAVLKEYINNGIKCSLSTEYETRSIDFSVSTGIRLQHAMIRKILTEIPE